MEVFAIIISLGVVAAAGVVIALLAVASREEVNDPITQEIVTREIEITSTIRTNVKEVVAKEIEIADAEEE